MNDLIKSFEGSLWNDSLSDVGQELLETAIDSVLENETLKSIPIVGTILGVGKLVKNIYDRNLLKNTLIFIKKINDGSISDREKEKYLSKMESSKKLESEIERVLILLNRNIDITKNSIFANLFIAYVKEQINWEDFCEMADITERLFLSDLEILNETYTSRGIKDINKIDYKVDRLTSLGLVENQNRISGGMFIQIQDETSDENSILVKTTNLGQKYSTIIFKINI